MGLVLLDCVSKESIQKPILGIPVVCSTETALDYLKNKNKYGNKDCKKAGRPKKEVPKFSIVKLDTPITIRFD